MSPEQYRIERERRGTQASIAALLRIDPQTISRRERGEIPITHEAGLALLSLPKKRKRPLRPANAEGETRRPSASHSP